MELSIIKDVVQTGALLSAGIYFLYKLIIGQLIVNLSLTASCHRVPIEGSHEDIVIFNISFKKGDRGCLEIHDAQVRATFNGKSITQPLIGIDRRSFTTESLGVTKRRRVNWQKQSEKSPLLHLSPNEESNFSCHLIVPKGEVCNIEFVLLGKRKNHSKTGQWRASCISAPI